VFLLSGNNRTVFRVVRYVPVWTDRGGRGYGLRRVCYIIVCVCCSLMVKVIMLLLLLWQLLCFIFLVLFIVIKNLFWRSSLFLSNA
jgi:hypothetical protein